jgi:cytochrome c biogenesis factor
MEVLLITVLFILTILGIYFSHKYHKELKNCRFLNKNKSKEILKLEFKLNSVLMEKENIVFDYEMYKNSVEDEIERQVAIRIAKDDKNLRIQMEEQHQEFQDTVIRLKSENIELKKIITDIEHDRR